MSLSDILARIDSDVQTEIDALEAAAQRDADDLLRTAEQQQQAQAARARVTADEQAAAAQSRLLARARLQAREERTRTRRQAIDALIAELPDALLALDNESYTLLFVELLTQHSHKGERVQVGERDFQRAGFLDALRVACPERDYAPTPADFAYGLLIQDEISCLELTPTSLVADLRRALEPALCHFLFDENVQDLR